MLTMGDVLVHDMVDHSRCKQIKNDYMGKPDLVLDNHVDVVVEKLNAADFTPGVSNAEGGGIT